jgi:predicted nucleic acid-binding protein
MDAETVTRALALLQDLPVTVLPGSLAEDLNVVASTARDHKLTAYDAAYLSLARREGVPFATLDAELAAVARKLGVGVLTGDRAT